MEIIYPFGPALASLFVAKKHVDFINEYTEKVSSLSDKQRFDHSHRLVGAVKEEISFAREAIESKQEYDEFLSFLDLSVREYYSRTFKKFGVPVGKDIKERLQLKEWDVWIVRQYEGDYNPMHHHSKYDVSGVLYTMVPNIIAKDKPYREKGARDGTIDFMYGAHQKLCEAKYNVRPTAGLMLIFPSTLIHTVYPFKQCDQERRSLAFNVNVSMNE